MANVIVYSTPICPWCVKVKDFLREHNIDFVDNDVSTDPKKLQEMMDKSGQMGVPVVDIDGMVILGFNEGKIKSALGL